MVIDNYTSQSQKLIDDFSDIKKEPQIVVSVDMMDTGIDVPEVVNLVFFKKVMSKAKFWQMIGRGTRLCPKLIDGQDKKEFYIFDFCGNFEFFRINEKGREIPTAYSVQEKIFNIEVQMVYKMQDMRYQTYEMTTFREMLVNDLVSKIKELNRNNFSVKQHLKYIDIYSNSESFNSLTPIEIQKLSDEIAPLILPYDDEINAVRFDILMYMIELGYMTEQKYSRGFKELVNKVNAVSKVSSIPEVRAKQELIKKILETDYLKTAGINEFEHIRTEMRDLIKYIQHGDNVIWHTDFRDDVISSEMHSSELETDDLKNYRMKAEHYIRQNTDNKVIKKLHTNKPLDRSDIEELEKILWSELGTKEDYRREYSDKPLGEFVREIVGLDMNSAKEAFSEYLNDVQLDDRQIYFVDQIINYIVHNGMMKDLSVLQEAPFTDRGEIGDIFTDITVWANIRKVIKLINSNAEGAA